MIMHQYQKVSDLQFTTIALWSQVLWWLSRQLVLAVIAVSFWKLTSIVFCWSMPRLCIRRRTCSLYSPTPISPSADSGCWYRTGLCAGTSKAIHLCSLICAKDRRLDGSRTNILRIKCSQSARMRKEQIQRVQLFLRSFWSTNALKKGNVLKD